MKRVFIFYYIMMPATVLVVLLTIYACTVYDSNKKQERMYDEQDSVCMDYFNDFDHFYDDYQLYHF